MFWFQNIAIEILEEMLYNYSISFRLRRTALFAFQNRTAVGTKFLGEIRLVMDVTKMLADLRQEREHIEEAIMTLERLARGRGKRRG